MARIAHGVGLAFAAGRREKVDLITLLHEGVVGRGQFGPPKSHRPTRRCRDGWIGKPDRNPFRAYLADRIWVFQAHLFFSDLAGLRARERKRKGSRLSALEDLIDPKHGVSLEQARVRQRTGVGCLETKDIDEAH